MEKKYKGIIPKSEREKVLRELSSVREISPDDLSVKDIKDVKPGDISDKQKKEEESGMTF